MEQKQPMTAYGHKKLSNEFNHLKTVERPSIVVAIEEALEHGDLKENSEYHAAKEKQRLTDGRLNELSDLLSQAQIIDPSVLAHKKVSFGSTVVLCDLDSDEELMYVIVGGCESSPERGLISFNSPLAKQLLGKEEGDEFVAKLPRGNSEYEVLSVKYEKIIFE
ncbi:MAG: transcription elongation factor GreA [Helicobacteraceae bacterium]|nr:transcription elongation factor GreA [Helicobacteraceae bacterium]